MRRSHRFLAKVGVRPGTGTGRGPDRRRAFTIVELLVAVAIISLLVALSLPALGRARQTAKRTECMNNLRNLNIAMLSVAERQRRFPACGNFGKGGMHHSFVLNLLPDLDQMNLYNKWNQEAGLGYPANQLLAQTHLPILTCPVDISVEGFGDLSYVVNGGVGFTVEYGGVHDCPIVPWGGKLDLNGNGQTCVSSTMPDGLPSDRELFFRMGLFFNETWKWDITVRHHKLDTVTDGLSQTLTMSENMRVGIRPGGPQYPQLGEFESLPHEFLHRESLPSGRLYARNHRLHKKQRRKRCDQLGSSRSRRDLNRPELIPRRRRQHGLR